MGTWTANVFSAEQQARLGVDEMGQPAAQPTPAAVTTPATLAATPARRGLCGGTRRAAEPANPELQALADGVRDEALRMAQASGWDGLFTRFDVV